MPRHNPRRPAGAAAAPSEAFMWRLFPGARKRCRECGREPLRTQDVAEHRKIYPKGKTEFLCVECRDAEVAASISRTRYALGLETKTPPAR